ncbi:MAG: hypothetical protein Q7R52_03010 [archaeon]|nr:hypothetical protein [archaeon]
MVCGGCKSGCGKTVTQQNIETGSLVTDMYTPNYGYYGDDYNKSTVLTETSKTISETTDTFPSTEIISQPSKKLKISSIIITSVILLGIGYLLSRGK